MSKQKIVILILSVVGLASTLMSWGVVYGISELAPDEFYSEKIEPGIARLIVMILYIIPLIVCIVNKSEYLVRIPFIASVTPPLLISVLIVILAVYSRATFNIRIDDNDDSDRLQIGPALYILFLVGILVPILGFALRKK